LLYGGRDMGYNGCVLTGRNRQVRGLTITNL
jgi:hypothetical protein